MNLKIKFVDALLFVVGPTLAPVLIFIKAGAYTTPDIWALVISCVIAFAGALCAYRSTKYAESKFTLTEKPITHE